MEIGTADKRLYSKVANGENINIESNNDTLDIGVSYDSNDGMQFIAIGGPGNAVSILAPTEPYPVLHSITQTGFVGSQDWLVENPVYLLHF